jgi:hypothetical protein
MTSKHIWKYLFAFLLFPPACEKGRAQAADINSELEFRSSDTALNASFAWAKQQALAYAHAGTDSIGPWYEAALPGRDAFCMRDVSHQTTGAAALGLYEANRNMLQRFASSVAIDRDWAGYWEIDKQGSPSSADYLNDDDFWYNLPANFDVIDAAYRMWLWTGDDTYIQSRPMLDLFRHSAHEYVNAWSLSPTAILSRPRIMNRHLHHGKFVDDRGIPSYSEETRDFTVGSDLIAAEYRAFRDLHVIEERQGHALAAKKYDATAAQFSSLLDRNGWNHADHHLAGSFSREKGWKGAGDDLALYFAALADPTHIRESLQYIGAEDHWKNEGIEAESYLPQTLYRYGDEESAYKVLLDLSRDHKPRREYPEVSYAVIAVVVTGAMGIEPKYDSRLHEIVLATFPQPSSSEEIAKLTGLRIFTGTVDVSEVGAHDVTMKNETSKAFTWRATFPGAHRQILVNGERRRAHTATLPDGRSISWVDVALGVGRTEVTRLDRAPVADRRDQPSPKQHLPAAGAK